MIQNLRINDTGIFLYAKHYILFPEMNQTIPHHFAKEKLRDGKQLFQLGLQFLRA